MKQLKNLTQHTSPLTLPRPEIGSAMSRITLNGRYEEALVLSVTCADRDSKKGWTATVIAKNGIEFVSGDTEHRGKTDWMPKDWIYHAGTGSWYSPVIAQSEEDEEVEVQQDTSPDVIVAVPEPWEDEKYFSWRSRVMKSDVRLKALPEVQAILSKVWKDKSFSEGIQL